MNGIKYTSLFFLDANEKNSGNEVTLFEMMNIFITTLQVCIFLNKLHYLLWKDVWYYGRRRWRESGLRGGMRWERRKLWHSLLEFNSFPSNSQIREFWCQHRVWIYIPSAKLNTHVPNLFACFTNSFLKTSWALERPSCYRGGYHSLFESSTLQILGCLLMVTLKEMA